MKSGSVAQTNSPPAGRVHVVPAGMPLVGGPGPESTRATTRQTQSLAAAAAELRRTEHELRQATQPEHPAPPAEPRDRRTGHVARHAPIIVLASAVHGAVTASPTVSEPTLERR